MAPDPRLLRAQRFPLHAAVEDGNLQNVLLVLKTEKSRINKKFEDSQQTALHVASSNATKDIVHELLKAGASIDEEDVVRQTALHYSVNNRDAGVLDLLIQEGAKIDPRRCRDGWTPLFIAAIFGNAKATRSLVNSGADVLLADNQGKGAEDWAANYRQHEICKILRAAPRKVTETSGQVYVDTGPIQPKKEVVFDAGMNLLMKKIEEKRKARLAKPKSAEQKKLDNERLNERISEVKEEVELVVHKLKDKDPKEKEKTEEELKKIEEAKRMLSQKRMECILEKERLAEERLKAQREDDEKRQKEQEIAIQRAEEEKLKSQQDEEEKIRKEKEMKEKIQLQKEKEEKLRIHKEQEDEEKRQKANEQKKLKELEEFRRKEEEKEIKRLEKEKRINAKQKKLEEEKENKKLQEEIKKQELERLKILKEERERLRLEEESKLKEEQKLKDLEEKERLEKEKQRAKEMAQKIELEKKKQLEELQKQEQVRQKQIKEEKEKMCLEEEIKLKKKEMKLELEEKERQEKKRFQELQEKESLENEKQKAKELAEEQLEEFQKQELERQRLIKEETERIHLEENKKKFELEVKEKERLEKEKDEKIRIQREKEDDERRKRAIEQKSLKPLEDEEIILKKRKKKLDLEEKERHEKEKEKELSEKMKLEKQVKIKTKEDREKEKERITVEQRNGQEEKLRQNERKDKEKENQKLLEEKMKKVRKKENEKQSEIGELNLHKGKENIRGMKGGIQKFSRGTENPNEVKLKDSTFKEKIIKEVQDIEQEALELEEILKKESNFQEIVPSVCQALNDDIKFNKKEIKIKTYDTIRGSKKFDEECSDWKVNKSKNTIFEEDDTEESSEISDQISISESSSMDMIEEKITNRWRGITPLKDLSISEEMKKLEEEKIKMEKERRLKSIQRKRKIQKENARMEQRRLKELEALKQIEQDNDRYETERRQKEIDMLRILKEAQEDIEKSEKQLDKKNKRKQPDIQKDFDEEMVLIKELEYNRLKKEMRQNEIQKNFDAEIKEIRERRFKRDIDRKKEEEEEEKYLIGNNFKSADRVKHKGISEMNEDGEEDFMHFLISQQEKTVENIAKDKKVKKYDQEIKSPIVRKSNLLNKVVDNIESFAVGDINMKDKGKQNELKRNEELYLENRKFEDERKIRKQKENIQLLKEREKIEQKLIDLRNMEQYEDELQFNINDEMHTKEIESVNDSEFDDQIFQTELERIKNKKRDLEFLRKKQLQEENSKIEDQRRIKNHEKKLKLQEEKQNIEKKLNNLENLYRLDSPENCTNNDNQIEEDICSMDISTLINMPVNKEFDQNFEIELERIKKKRSELDSIRKEQLADEKNKIEELRKVKNQERNKKLQEERENIERKLCDLEKINRFSDQEKFKDVPDEIEEETYNIDESMLDNVDLLKDLDEERLWIEESKKNKELKRKEQLELENIKREEERKFRHAKEMKKLEDEQKKIDERRLRDLKTIKHLEDENQSLEKEIDDNKLKIAKRIEEETFQMEEQIFLKNRNRITEEEEERARIERRKREIELGKQKLLEDEKKIMEEEKILNSLKRKKRQEEEQAKIDQRRYKELEKIKLLEEENQRLESKKMKEIEVLKKLEYEQKKIMEEKKRIELQKKREKEEEFERIEKEKVQKRIDEQLEIEMEQARIQKEKKRKYIEKKKQLAEENEKIEKEKREKDIQFHEQLSKEIAIVERNKLEEMEKINQIEEDRKQLEEKKKKEKEEKEKLMDIANDKYKKMQRTKELQKLEKESLRVEERRLRDLQKIQELENENKKIIHEKLMAVSKDNSHVEEIDKKDIMTNEIEIKPFKQNVQNEKDDKEDKNKENDELCKVLPQMKIIVDEKETSKLKEILSDNVSTMLDSENHDDNRKLSNINKLRESNESATNDEKIHETKDEDFETQNRMENGITCSEFDTTDIKKEMNEKAVMSEQINMTSNNDYNMIIDKPLNKNDHCNSSTETSVMEDGNLNIENLIDNKSYHSSPHKNENGLEIQNKNSQAEKKLSTDMKKDILSKKISPTEDDKKLLEKEVPNKPPKQSPPPIEQTLENTNECYIMDKKSVQEIDYNTVSTELIQGDDKKTMESICIENAGIENKKISQELPVLENSHTSLVQQSNSEKGYMLDSNDKSNSDNQKNISVENASTLVEQNNSHKINAIDKQKESIVDLIFESDIGDSDLIRNKMQQFVHEPCTSTIKELSKQNIQRAQTVSQFPGSLNKSESVIENSKSSPTLSMHTDIKIYQKDVSHNSESYECEKKCELPKSDKNSNSNSDSKNNDTSRIQKDCSLFLDLKGNDMSQAHMESSMTEDCNQFMFQQHIDSSCTKKDDELPSIGSPNINSPSKNIPSESKEQQLEEVQKNKIEQNINNANEIQNTQQSLDERKKEFSPSCDNVPILSTQSGRLQEILTSTLPDEVEDPEFSNRIQVFTNYKQFGAMYASKNNWKKAEWAYATGIKQVIDADKPAKSKQQLQTVLETEVEFRIQRASALQALGRVSEAVGECRTVLTIDKDHQEAGRLIRGLQSNIYDARPSGR